MPRPHVSARPQGRVFADRNSISEFRMSQILANKNKLILTFSSFHLYNKNHVVRRVVVGAIDAGRRAQIARRDARGPHAGGARAIAANAARLGTIYD